LTSILGQVVRLVLAAVAIAIATYAAQGALMDAALPLLEIGCNFLRHDFLTRLRIEPSAESAMVQMTCTALAPIRIGAARWIPAYGDFDGGAVHVLHVLVPFVLYLATLSAWPVRRWQELMLRGAFAAALGLPAILLPSVLLLLGRISGEIASAADGADAAYGNGWVQAMLFMEMCGAWLTPILVGCLVAVAAQRCLAAPSPAR
jgi:hypothetical protein